MLFSKTIEPMCSYCQRGRAVEADTVLCIKKGIMAPSSACPSFRYDPLKRVPPRPASLDIEKLRKEDFSI